MMIKECRYIKTNGLKCQSPAMRGSSFCYFHGRKRIYVARPDSKKPALQLPRLQSQSSIHIALDEVAQAIASGKLDAGRAGKLLYALQMAQETVWAARASHPAWPPSVPTASPPTDH
jgi:hypothetical protein